MRNKLAKICSILVIFQMLSTVVAEDKYAVARQHNFREYNLFDGLAQGQVTSIQQDSRGYIWFGSYAGVSRYNGNQIDNFSLPVPSNTVRSIVRTNNDELIVTTAAGLCYLRQDEFDCIGESEKLPFVDLFQVFVAQDSSLWIGSDSGIMHLKSASTDVYTMQQGLPSRSVRVVIEDHNGKVWAGTEKGLVYLKDGQFVAFSQTQLNQAPIRALLDTPEGLWVGSNNGLYFISHETQEITQIGADRFEGNGFLAIFLDSRGILWLGTYKGLYRIVNDQIERLAPQKGLKNVTTYAITEDTDGTLWFGSDSGLIKYVPGPFVSYTTGQGLSHDFVRAISVAEDGKVWMGTRHGVSIFDPEKESFTTLIEELKLDQLRIYAIKNLPDKSVLIGTQNGLIHWRDNEVAGIFTTDEGLPSAYVSAFLVDQKQRVWIGTSHGLIRWENDKLVPVKQSSFPIGTIFSMQTDKTGRLWLGTGSYGVVVFDPVEERYLKLDSIPQAGQFTVWAIARDKQGDMWIGTNGSGLLQINEKFELLNVFDANNKLNNNYVWQVMVDSRDDVWAYTNNGLKRYDRERFVHFDGSDGLLDLEGAATASAEDLNGDLWFGTGYGVSRYSPGSEQVEVDAPPILIENVSNNNQKISQYAQLDYGNSALTVQFASLSYREERDLEFSYRLLGASDEWSSYQRNNRTQFSNLSPGDYQFQVRAISDHRVPSEVPASFYFSIVPPFWLTWWFIGACFILSFGLIVVFAYFRMQSISAERDRLEQVVNERTIELTSTNEELKRLASTDDLTKLHNRRFLLEHLNQEVRRLSRSAKKTSLAFIIMPPQ